MEREISQKDFAEAVGVTQSHISDILSGRRRITTTFAIKVQELLGIHYQLLLEQQKSSSDEIDVKESKKELDAKANIDVIDKLVSVKTLLKFAKIKAKTNIDKLVALTACFKLSNDANQTISQMTNGCFRKSSSTGLDRRMISSWVVIVNAVSHSIHPKGIFDRDRMEELCNKVAMMLHQNDSNLILRINDLLSEYGIGLIRVDKVEHASIDGYSFFNNGVPYIALTCRYDRIDNLAFTVLHELAHLALGHTTEDRPRINLDLRSYDEDIEDAIEDEANEYAGNILIPAKVWKFAPAMSLIPHVIQKKYTAWAESKNLNPWIVLGRLSYETGIYKFKSYDSRRINGGKEELRHEIVMN